jgi:DNA-binding MarR family transcriptional regulator
MNRRREDDAAFVVDALRRLVRDLRVTAHQAERDVGVTGAQLFVLRELSAEPDLSIKRLSERTLTDPSSVSVVVSRLVSRGFVKRRRNPADARETVLTATDRGLALLGRAKEPYQARLVAALRALPRARLVQLRLGLSALLGASGEPRGAAPLFFEDAPPARRRRRPRGRAS